MKKYLILISFLMFSCENISLKDAQADYLSKDYTVREIEGCEYIFCGANNQTVMSHKGNCRNPIHIYNLEKK